MSNDEESPKPASPTFARIDHTGVVISPRNAASTETEDRTNGRETKSPSSGSPPLDYCSWKVDLSNDQPHKMALRSGKFKLDGGRIADFVFVPEHYKFDTEESFFAILHALKIPSEPEIVFQFATNYGVVPNIDHEETSHYWKVFKNLKNPHLVWQERNDLKFPHPKRDYVRIKKLETRAQNIMNAISEASSQSSAIYLLTDPFRGNKMAEMACRSASEAGHGSVYTLGLFLCDDFSIVDTNKQENRKSFEPLDDNISDDGADSHTILPWSDRFDQRRKWLDRYEVFQKQDVVVTNGDFPRYAISITCNRTEIEDSFLETYRHHSLPNGLASECSHRLVFETRKSKEDFEDHFLKRFPTGSIIAGSLAKELENAVDCIRAGRPVFTLLNSGVTADAVAMLFRYATRLQNKTLAEKEDRNLYLKYNFPPSVGLWNQLSLDNRIWSDTRVIAETFPSLVQFYNPETNRILDLNDQHSVEKLQDTITWVFGCAFDATPELGGIDNNSKSIAHAEALQKLIATAAHRFKMRSQIFQVLIRGVIIVTVLLTVVQSQVDEDGSEFEFLKIWNIILPLAGSALMGLEASYRPALKFAALLIAGKRIESETYRFRTRTGIYRNRKGIFGSNRQHPRSLFADRIQDLFEDCMQSDVASGSIFKTGNEIEQLNKQKNNNIFGLGIVSKYDGTRPNDPIGEWWSLKGRSTKSSLPALPERKKTFGTNIYTGSKITRTDAKSDTFYSHSDGLIDPDFQEASQPGIFYSRGPTFLPSEQFLAEEANAQKRLDELEEINQREAKKGKQGFQRDGILRGQDYVNERLRPTAVMFWTKLPRKTKIKGALIMLIACITASATGFVSFGLHEWVPLLLAISSALEYASAYMHLDTRIPSLNASATELTNIESWWNGLSLIQSRQQSIRDELVDRTESAIISYYAKYTGATQLLAEQRHAVAAAANRESNRGNRNGNISNVGGIMSRTKVN